MMTAKTLTLASACGQRHRALGLVLLGAVALPAGDRSAAGEAEPVLKQRKHFDGVVLSVAFSPDGKTLVAGGGAWEGEAGEDSIKLWDVPTSKERAALKGRPGTVNSVSFSPDGKTLAAGCWDAMIRLWDVG